MELIEKLAALVPPPRLNLIRYHGVLAPSARDRSKIVPQTGTAECATPEAAIPPQQRAHRLAWATLLARVFAVDVTECHECGGSTRIVAALTDPLSIRAYLEGVGLPARPPPMAPARRSLQSELEFAA